MLDHNILITCITNLITAAATYIVSRRKRNNDFISELQNSIDLLSSRYNTTLEELCELKQTNITLTCKVQTLINENNQLKKQILIISRKLPRPCKKH